MASGRRVLATVCRHLAPTAASAAPADGVLPALPAQSRLVLRYLRAFDAWQRLSNPRDPASVEPARQRVAEAGRPAGSASDDGGGDVFLTCISELASSPSALSDANVDEWLQVLGNLSLSHRKNILGEQVEGGGKERAMTHGIKYKLYELRNAPGLEPLRVYWVGNGAYGAEDQADEAGVSDADWTALDSTRQPEGGTQLPTGIMHIDDDHDDPKNATLEPQGLPKLLSLTSAWSASTHSRSQSLT